MRPALLLSILVLVAAGAAYGFTLFRRSAAAAQARQQLIADVVEATSQQPVDGDELSRLVLRIQEVPGHAADRQLALALARIESARGRLDRAFGHIEGFVTGPDATLEELRFAANLQLLRHGIGTRNGPELLRQARGFAVAAAELSHDADDLLLAWTAAVRQADGAAVESFAEQILKDHPGSLAAQLVQASKAFTPEAPPPGLDELAQQFAEPPAELQVMRATVLVQQQRPAEALALLRPALRNAAALVEVRNLMAVALHLQAQREDDPERRRAQLVDRDQHLDWLLANAPAADTRRALWLELQKQR